jgi:large subunit ribosomal protein L18e
MKSGKQLKSNPNTLQLIDECKRMANENSASIWKYIAELLEKPERHWAEVNTGKLEKYGKDGATVLVPGKLLGGGSITKPLTVTAFKSSTSARKKIVDAGGCILSIPELIEKNPKGTGILIMK